MFDPAKQTWLSVAPPPPGFMHVDPVAIQPRPEPAVAEATTVDPALAARGMGLVEVRSVYDTDDLGRMGDAALADADRAGGCAEPIPKTEPNDPQDTRRRVAHLVRLKDPADPAYGCGPARFIRFLRAVAPPVGGTDLRRVLGETDFEQQQILGYAPIEPDGSFKLELPADVPLALVVTDAQGRGFQTHTNWLQLRPGERRTCDGCHSPRRGGSLNSGAVVNQVPAAWRGEIAAARQSGETMASTRTRLDPAALALAADLVSSDPWADTTKAGVRTRSLPALRYTGNADPADDLATPAPQRGIINYPDHIQPLWSRDRGSGSCLNCHGAGAALDLSAGTAGSGRLRSYDNLLIGPPRRDPATGRLLTQLFEGVPVLVRAPALVHSAASESEALGQARQSRLMEILSGDTLSASADARRTHPTPAAPDHSRLLNRAEKRLLAEWMDLGGQYMNDPFDAQGRPLFLAVPSRSVFDARVLPVLTSQCQGCHAPAAGTAGNRLVLTGDAEGDYNVVLTLISDACSPPANPLLQRPLTAPHPSGASAAVLAAGSTDYQAIATWIAGGCGR